MVWGGKPLREGVRNSRETWWEGTRKVNLGDGQPYAVVDNGFFSPLDAVFWMVYPHHISGSDRIGQCLASHQTYSLSHLTIISFYINNSFDLHNYISTINLYFNNSSLFQQLNDIGLCPSFWILTNHLTLTLKTGAWLRSVRPIPKSLCEI